MVRLNGAFRGVMLGFRVSVIGLALNLEILGRAEFTNGDRVFYMLPEQQRSAGHRANTSASAPAW